MWQGSMVWMKIREPSVMTVLPTTLLHTGRRSTTTIHFLKATNGRLGERVVARVFVAAIVVEVAVG